MRFVLAGGGSMLTPAFCVRKRALCEDDPDYRLRRGVGPLLSLRRLVVGLVVVAEREKPAVATVCPRLTDGTAAASHGSGGATSSALVPIYPSGGGLSLSANSTRDLLP